jgi:hypothetical protein
MMETFGNFDGQGKSLAEETDGGMRVVVYMLAANVAFWAGIGALIVAL